MRKKDLFLVILLVVTNRRLIISSHGRRSQVAGEESFPDEVLLTDDPKLLCSCLCKYVMETRKENGQPYPPKTLFNLLSGLQRYIRENKANPFNILDQKKGDFLPLHNVMDSFFRQLHSEGIGTNPQQSSIISIEEEDLLWRKGVMGVSNPKQLLHAVFYYCGLYFCLRGGDEHRALKFSQFVRLVVPDPENPGESTVCYEYTEHGSKNNLGGVKQVRKQQQNKVVRHFANPKIGDKCLVQLLDLYLSKRPSFEAEKSDCDAFYLRPLDKFDASDPDCPWFYYARAIGHNLLKGMLKAMCREGGIPFPDRSNHSLRATGATRMLDAGVPEKVIMDRTGHHLLDGLKPYARVTDFQQQQVSAVMTHS